jgi:hypothetical protein
VKVDDLGLEQLDVDSASALSKLSPTGLMDGRMPASADRRRTEEPEKVVVPDQVRAYRMCDASRPPRSGSTASSSWCKLAWDRRGTAMADTPDVRPVGDLPNEIGKTAARELSANGITSLEQIARHSQKELLAIHGVGPKAIRIIGEALAVQGLGFTGAAREP